jgi:hypothetical protein
VEVKAQLIMPTTVTAPSVADLSEMSDAFGWGTPPFGGTKPKQGCSISNAY